MNALYFFFALRFICLSALLYSKKVSQKGKKNVKKDVGTLARQAEKAEQSHTYITVSRKQ